MKSAVIVFPGRTASATWRTRSSSSRGASRDGVARRTRTAAGTDLVVLPGASPYGDTCAAGDRRAAPIMGPVRDHARKGGLVMGVCNGFQILCEAELLPGILLRNAKMKFLCRDVHLKIERSDTPFTRGYNAGQVIRVPVAHGEGNYFASEGTIGRLEAEGRILFRYTDAEGKRAPKSNVNGALNSIAGVLNEKLNVLGLMPHPENHVENAIGCTDGRGLFAGLVAHFAQAA